MSLRRHALEAFRKGLREIGWVEGRTFTIEARFADGTPERLHALAAELGANLTGVTALGQALSAKRLELLKEAVPGIRRVVVVVNPTSLNTAPFLARADHVVE